MSIRDDIQRFRRSQHSAYVAGSSGECEVEPYLLARSKAFRVFSLTNATGGLELAHIWGRRGMACDAFCAIIRLGHAAHAWSHVGTGTPSPRLAVEAASLAAKFAQHQDQLSGPLWHRSARQRHDRWFDVSPVQDDSDIAPLRRHWNPVAADAARAACVGYNTLRGRVEYLHSQLCESAFGDVTERLLKIVGST